MDMILRDLMDIELELSRLEKKINLATGVSSIDLSAYAKVYEALGAWGKVNIVEPGNGDDIQKKIDALPSFGGMVFIPGGTYEISSTIIVSGNIKIISAGPGDTILKLADGADCYIMQTPSDSVAENIVIKGIKFDGNSANQTVWVALLVLGANGNKAKNVRVEDCYFYDSTGDAIYCIGDDIVVAFNKFEDIADSAIAFSGNTANYSGFKCNRVQAIANHMINCNGGVAVANDSDDILVAFNEYAVDDTTLNTQRFVSLNTTANGTRAPYHVRIIGNTACVQGGTNASVVECRVTDCKDVRIIGNRIFKAGNHGIYAQGEDIVVASNHIEKADDAGIVLRLADSAVCAFNTIKNCDQGGLGYPGIQLYSSTKCRIIGNKSYDDQTVATQERGYAEDAASDGNYVAYNVFEGNVAAPTFRPNTIVKHNEGYVSEAGGVATFSGDGTTTSFSISHGLATTPSYANVTAETADAAGDFYITRGATTITVTYATAPPTGTNNVVLSWYAEV